MKNRKIARPRGWMNGKQKNRSLKGLDEWKTRKIARTRGWMNGKQKKSPVQGVGKVLNGIFCSSKG